MNKISFDDARQALTISNIFCIGRNYAAHIAELGNIKPKEPVVFLKPTSALNTSDIIQLPTFSNDVHYETELVLLIQQGGKNIQAQDAMKHIGGYGIGLDLTARDVQTVAKENGLPWTIAKGFDGAACVSHFLPVEQFDSEPGSFTMTQNGILKQTGDVRLMLFPIPHLISYLSSIFTLQAGDLIFTGTPEGVGPLHTGDQIELNLADKIKTRFLVRS